MLIGPITIYILSNHRYPITEMKYVNVSISEQYALSATSKAEEELAVLGQSTSSQAQLPDHTTLRYVTHSIITTTIRTNVHPRTSVGL